MITSFFHRPPLHNLTLNRLLPAPHCPRPSMKTHSSLKLVCSDCFFVKRKGVVFVRCTTTAKHKQRQGMMTGVEGAEQPHLCAPNTTPSFNKPAGFQAMNHNLFNTTSNAPAPSNGQMLFGFMTGFRNFGGNKPF